MPIFARRGTRRLPRTNRRPLAGSSYATVPSTEALAKAISEIFSEVIIAPDFEAEARSDFAEEKEPAADSAA